MGVNRFLRIILIFFQFAVTYSSLFRLLYENPKTKRIDGKQKFNTVNNSRI